MKKIKEDETKALEKIKKINKNDSLQFEEMTDRVEDKKRNK